MNRSSPYLAVVASILIGGCGGTSEPTTAKDLAECYKTEFDTPPPATVGSLQAKQIVVRDSGGQWLRFTADAATIDSILARGFHPSDQDTFSRNTGGANTPSWWRPSPDRVTAFYFHPNWKKHFGANSSSEAYLAHDANKKLVYFMCSVMD